MWSFFFIEGAPKQCKMALVALDKLVGEKDHVMTSILQDLCKPMLLTPSCRRIEVRKSPFAHSTIFLGKTSRVNQYALFCRVLRFGCI